MRFLASEKLITFFCNKEEATALVGENFVEALKDITNNYVVTNGAESS